jgi:hypothetical protein
MWFWKHNKSEQPVTISTKDLKKLPDHLQQHFSPATRKLHGTEPTHRVESNDDSFGLSLAVGMATDNAGLGYIAGGSLSGALIGEALAESEHHEQAEQSTPDFGGGSGGGGGATDSWDSSSQPDSGSGGSDYASSDSSSSYDSSSSSFDNVGN